MVSCNPNKHSKTIRGDKDVVAQKRRNKKEMEIDVGVENQGKMQFEKPS